MKTDKYVDGDVCEALRLLIWAVEKYVLPMEVLKEEIKIKISFFVSVPNSKHSERHQKHLNQNGQVRLHELHSPGLKHSVIAAPAEGSQALL